jgi:amino acid adenylation domain-containing protein
MTADQDAASTESRKLLAGLGADRLARSDVLPLSAAQQRLWLADQALPGLPAYHLVRVIELDGQLDIAALGASLSEIVLRHEALRTSVLAVAGQPLQRVARPAAVQVPVTDTTEAAAGKLAAAAASRPFDVAGGSLWRSELHRLGPRRHRLVLVWHHIIADAATIAMLLSELAHSYRAFCDGRAPELPAAVAYRSYVRWERAFADDPDYARQLEYWQGQLAGSEPLALAGDWPRPVTARRPAARVPVLMAATAADALRAAARANGVTLAQLLLAGYAVVLHRFSGRADFTIGMPVSLRRDDRWASSAGLYVTTLPVRVSIAGNPPFSELLRQVRGTVLAALGAADVPLERAAGSAGSLYDVTFGLVQDRVPALDLPGLTTRVGVVYSGRAKFDLHLEIADPGPGRDLDGVLEYDAERFGRETAQRLADGTAAVLRAVAAAPGRRIGDLPAWAEAPGLLDAGRAAGRERAGPRIDRLFAAAASARPGHVALVDAADGSQLTYAELAARAVGLAGALAARGVRRGDFVGIALPRSADMIVAVLGVLAAGAAYVPLDSGYPAGQLAEMISRSGVRLVIGDPLPGQRVPVISLPAGTVPLAPPAGRAAPAVAGDGGDPAYVMFTSGSTGQPKAVVVPHRAVVRLVRGSGFAAMTGAERWLHAAAPAFDAATLELWAPLLNGGTVVVLPGMPTVASLGEAIRRYQVTSAFLTTGLFNLVVDTDVESLRPLTELVIGGEAASPDHVRRALHVVATVVNGYGPTENTTFTTCHPLRDPAEVTVPLPLGRPIHGTSVHIVDDYGHPVPAGVTGEILAGGQGLALGYAGEPGLTAQRFVPSPFGPPGARLYRTGDYGRIGADGAVQFAGRHDDQVKVRGFRIELGAVEQALTAHPDVAQAVVIAHADLSGDRRLVGYIVGRVPGPELSRYLAGILPSYMIPGQWISLAGLPLGATGKVDRRALPAPGARSARPARPVTVTEELLVAWYSEFLGLADVTPETDFFAVGGHSLLASRLAARIRAVLAVDVPLTTVFEHPRLADLAAATAVLERTEFPPLRPGGGHSRLPLSYAQERMWFLQRYAPASAQYHVPIAVDLTGDLDQAALASAIQAVADRHPMLRVVFGEHDGQPYQSILPAGTQIALPQTDLTMLEPGQRPAALGQLAAAVFTEPFDLTSAPPIRAALVRTGTRRHRLLLVVHHLVADGWSLPLIYHDLAGAYSGDLPPAQELTYGDFAGWQRAALATPAAGRLAGYWRDQLAGSPARLCLDGDLPGQPGAGAGEGPAEGAGGICRLAVPAGLAGRVRETGRHAGATPFATLLAAFVVLLSRHTPQRDLVIGTPVAGREDVALTDMVGLFLNTLPLRIDAAGEPAFTELIRRVRETVVAGLEHAGLPFERIVELAGLPRASGHQPLVQVLFALQPAIRSRFALGEVTAEVQPAHHGTAKFDLTMSLFDDGDGFSGYLEYRSDLFSPAYAAAFAAEFTELLGNLAGDPGQLVGAAAAPSGPPVTPETAAGGSAEAASSTKAPGRPSGAATAGLQAEIGRLWEHLLGVPAGRDTNFFAIGGHSLAAMRVIAELRDRLGRDVPVRDLFDYPALGAFTARVAAAPPVTARPPLRSGTGTGPAPLTAEQERHWVLYQMEPDSPAQNVPMVLRLRGPLDVTALAQALTLVSVRQAVLRTTFEAAGGVPAQRTGPPVTITLPVTDVTSAALDDVIRRDAEEPFDLTAAPPWRVTLLRHAPDDHYLLLTLHHIICDGWSMPVLLTELAACYAGGPAAQLPPVHVQYADYARWQRDWLRDGRRSGYWLRQLTGVPDLELPTDRPRPARPGHRSGEVEIFLDEATRDGLESLARAEGATLFTAVLGVFATVLGRHSGQSDFAIGTFHANRDDVATQRLVGYFVNNLALRCDLSGRPTWRSLLGRMRGVVTDAYSHLGTPFERVISELRVQRDPRQTPLFQAMCVLQNLPALPDRIGPLDVTIERRPYERADFDITLWLRHDGGGLRGGLIYDADLFVPQTAARLARLFRDLVDACLTDPDGLVAAAARTRPEVIRAEAIRAEAIRAVSGRAESGRAEAIRAVSIRAEAIRAESGRELAGQDAAAAPGARTARTRHREPLARRFAAQAAATPAAIALTWPTAPGGAAVMTYAELAAAAGRLAARLRQRGVGTESRVGVYLGRSAAAVVAFLAVAQAGGGYVPVDPEYPARRVAELLADADVGWLLTTPGLRDRLSGHGAEILEIGERGEIGETAEIAEADEIRVTGPELPVAAGAELGYVIFTSGSTGRPKAVLVSSENLAAYLDSIMPALDLRPSDRVLAFAATTFDATTEELYPALLCGASVALRPAGVRVPDAAFDALLEATRPTVLSLPVTFWHAWADRLAREGGRVPGDLRMLLLNAEEPSVHRYRQWCEAGGAAVRFVNTYGPTEATVTASLYEPGPEATAHDLWDRFPIGTALPGVTAQVLDPAAWPVPDGAIGELCLGGPSVTRGYGGQPGLTAAAYWPDACAAEPGARLYRTGDLVRRLADGTLLLLGRGDRQVKIRGHRVELGEVEAVLLGHPAVAQASVLAAGTGDFRQLVAYVAPARAQPAVREPAGAGRPEAEPAGAGRPEAEPAGASLPEEVLSEAVLSEEVLRAYLAERLPQYMIPARLPVLPALPLTPNRKVDRQALAARLAGDLAVSRPGADAAGQPPGTPAEQRLHDIWCAVLGRPAVGVHDNFFGIGGDSIRGLQIVTQARDAGLALTVGDLFDRQTIAELAALADGRLPADDGAEPPAARLTGLTDGQLRGALARIGKS